MKKSLIALAVAGAFAAPAFAATSNVDVYGVMNIALEDTNAANITPGIVSNTSRIGFKGSEDLGGGLKALWQIESGISGNGSVTGTGAALANRNTFIGLAGGFGTVVMGRHDTPYKLGTGSLDPFSDTIADYNLGRLNGVDLLMNSHDARVGSALAYISPTWSGFHFAAAVVMENDAVAPNDDTYDALSATAVYSNGPLFGSLSYQNVKDIVAAGADSTAWKLGLGYTFGDAKVGFIYEKVDADTTAQDRKSWQLNGVYNMGPIALKAVYGQISDANFGITANNDKKMFALGADYAMSKRTTAYVVYGNGDADVASANIAFATPVTGAAGAYIGSAAGDVDGWNIGLKHSF